jgi:hypothetical protein
MRQYNRSKMPRLRWTSGLHHCFVHAIRSLGGHHSITVRTSAPSCIHARTWPCQSIHLSDEEFRSKQVDKSARVGICRRAQQLGTTTSCCAVLDSIRPTVLENITIPLTVSNSNTTWVSRKSPSGLLASTTDGGLGSLGSILSFFLTKSSVWFLLDTHLVFPFKKKTWASSSHHL